MEIYPPPACVPSSGVCSLSKTGDGTANGNYNYDKYTAVVGSTIRMSYNVKPLLRRYLFNYFLSLYNLYFYSSLSTRSLGIYSSSDGFYPTNFLGDFDIRGQGTLDILVSQAQFIQVQAYDRTAGPLVRNISFFIIF